MFVVDLAVERRGHHHHVNAGSNGRLESASASSCRVVVLSTTRVM
jgi:hypothetical protein